MQIEPSLSYVLIYEDHDREFTFHSEKIIQLPFIYYFLLFFNFSRFPLFYCHLYIFSLFVQF